MLDTGYWILDTGYWILDTRYWILDLRLRANGTKFKVQVLSLIMRNSSENVGEVKKNRAKMRGKCGFFPHILKNGHFTVKTVVSSATLTADESAGLVTPHNGGSLPHALRQSKCHGALHDEETSSRSCGAHFQWFLNIVWNPLMDRHFASKRHVARRGGDISPPTLY